jgi:hypothetical protein
MWFLFGLVGASDASRNADAGPRGLRIFWWHGHKFAVLWIKLMFLVRTKLGSFHLANSETWVNKK